MDLVRAILLKLEEQEDMYRMARVEVEGFTPEQVAYHLGLLKQAGLIEATAIRDKFGASWIPESITWEGHEFLDEAKDAEHWSRAKALAKEKGGALSFEAVKTALTELTKRAILLAASSAAG